MSESVAAKNLADRIYHGVCLVPEDGSGLSAHAVWDLKQLMRNLNIRDDLTSQEVMAMAVVLAGANDRKLRRTEGSGGGGRVRVGNERELFLRVV